MKQILQDLRQGTIEVADVPCPSPGRGEILVRTCRSLVSAGTERMLLEFGRASLLNKVRQQPERAREVLDKIRTDGLVTTLEAVQAKLAQPLPLGYCNAGVVLEVGSDSVGFTPGDRVVSNGYHAEVVRVPKNLCAKIPEGVDFDSAAFTVMGAIALQGVRLAMPTLGERFAVSGLGLVGLMAVQILRANGVQVLGIDFDQHRLALARRFGAETVDLAHGEDPLSCAERFSRGLGMDGVLVAAATESSAPIRQAAQMCRKRGRIVLVGVTGLELSRADFYEKELTFQVSCSYGPGRYDPAYEREGFDYPVGFVRWTEQRNFEAVLELMAAGQILTAPLISHRFPLNRAQEAYELLARRSAALGIVIEYPEPDETQTRRLREPTVFFAPPGARELRKREKPTVGVIGAGNFATRVLLPAFRRAGVRLKVVASEGGLSGAIAGRRFGFESATTDVDAVLADNELDLVVIATRHDSHADLAARALKAGRSVFVEKPLAISSAQLSAVEAAMSTTGGFLMVGFNRRFAPQVRKIKTLLAGSRSPKSFVITVNAGALPRDHWTQDRERGGGRLIGEACHFVDLLRFLAGSPMVDFQVAALFDPVAGSYRDDEATLTLAFADGSIGTVHYLASGHRSFPKERLEVFTDGRVLQLDNFRRLRGFGWPGFRRLNRWRQDKGHEAMVEETIAALREGRGAPIPFDEVAEVSRICLEMAEAMRRRHPGK